MTTHNIDTWTKYQKQNSKKIITQDTIDINNIKYVGGLDISFNKHDVTDSCAYLTIMDYLTLKIVYEDHEKVNLMIPYVSGYLGFREVPVYSILLDRIKIKNPEYYPQITLIDGFGILHQREFGSASHLGFEKDIPTIGVGKTLMCHDGLDEKILKSEFKKNCLKKGDYVELIGNSGRVHGVALKSSDDMTNPIYVSIGHKISLESAIRIVNQLCLYRVPEPIRISDIKSKLFLNKST